MNCFPELPEGIETPSLGALLAPNASSTTRLQYTCELITPMYGGGVEPGQVDPQMPIRATAIRGQLRFWWRILFGAPADSRSTFEDERNLWGGLALGDGRDESDLKSSAVRLQISQKPSEARTEDSKPNYAYGPASNNPTVQWLSPGYRWTIVIECPVSLHMQVEQTVRWWATFGGVGSRTRRGFGAIQIDGVSPVTTQEHLHGCTFKLSPQQFNDASKAWEWAYERLKAFRQGEGVGRTRRYGQSHWPEPDAIRNLTSNSPRHKPRHSHQDTFPRAQFGLPLIFKFKDQDVRDGDPQTTTLLPKGAERYASPLIVRPYLSSHTKKWHPLALLLPNWADSFELDLTLGGRSLLAQNTSWVLPASVASPIVPLANRGADALGAFMTFFVERDTPKSNTKQDQRVVAPFGPSPNAKEDEVVCWGKVRVQRNRANRTLTAQHTETPKSASASGDAADALLATLPRDTRQKLIDRGSYHFLVTVHNGVIVKLEPAQ